MKTVLTITDVTRMAPPFVCVAGVAEDRRNIRLQFERSRIDEDWLCNNGAATIRPFARVGFDLLAPRPEPPHTEDWYVDPDHLEAHGRLTVAERFRFLSSICEPSVEAIFKTEILKDPGFYVLKGKGSRSLGTIRLDRLFDITYQCFEHGWDCRLRFRDGSGAVYYLKVKDLTFCSYLDHLRDHENMPCEQIVQRMACELSERECFLRIGLARGWARFPERCYLQATGVFTSPDYLEGRWFADFTTPAAYRAAGVSYLPSIPSEKWVRETPPVQVNFATARTATLPQPTLPMRRFPPECPEMAEDLIASEPLTPEEWEDL